MVTRRNVVLGAAGCALAACAADAPLPPTAAAQTPLLTPWITLAGGWLLDTQRLPGAPLPAAPRQRVNFVQPVGVAALGDTLLVADAAARTVWRLDRGRDAASPYTAFTGSVPEAGASLVLANDFNAWIAHPAEHRVAQYDVRGRFVREWRDEFNVSRPVAVAVRPDRSEVLVGDGVTARIAVFDPMGRIVRLLGRGTASPLQSVTAMAAAPGGVYVLDRIAQQVLLLGAGGEVLDVVGENQLVQPRALAVDAHGRVFVSDDAGQLIKVFRGSKLIASAGGAGAGPGRFGRIEALAADGNMLYVADSASGRVQILLVAPPSMERGS